MRLSDEDLLEILTDADDEDEAVVWRADAQRADGEVRCYALTRTCRDQLVARFGQTWLETLLRHISEEARAWGWGGVGGIH